MYQDASDFAFWVLFVNKNKYDIQMYVNTYNSNPAIVLKEVWNLLRASLMKMFSFILSLIVPEYF